jgi:hypothetical protein
VPRRVLLPFLVFAAALVLGSLRFRGFVIDDDAIAHRLGERLASGDGLTVNDGEFVHGVTALLGVLVSGLASWLGLDPFLVSGLHSSAWAVSCGFLVLATARRHGVRDRYALLLGAALLVALPFSLWSLGLVGVISSAASAGWALHHLSAPEAPDRRLLLASLFLVLLTLCRIDGFVLALPILLVAAVLHGLRRGAVFVALPFLAGWGVLLFLQYLHFDSLFPDMASTKASLSAASLAAGADYLIEFLRVFLPVTVFGALVTLRGFRRSGNRIGLATLFVAASYVAYLVTVGGDWMPGYRHFAVVLLLLVVALISSAGSVRALLLAVALLAGSAVVSLFTEPAQRALDASSWFADCEEGATALAELLTGQDPLLAVEPLGCPSWFTEFRLLDMVGLFEDHIAHVDSVGRPVSWVDWQRARNAGPLVGTARSDVYVPGHGKGDGDYVWEREPDLFLLCDPLATTDEGCFRSWSELRSGFPIESRYQPLRFRFKDGTRWSVWVRFDGGVTGVRRDAATITVPSWLLASTATSPVRATDEGVQVVADAGATVPMPELALEPGRYRVAGLPAGAIVLPGCGEFRSGVLTVTGTCRSPFSVSTQTESVLTDLAIIRL